MSTKVNIKNRKAKFNYELLSKYIAGIVLTGSEIKSIRQSRASISESFCKFDDKGELYILNIVKLQKGSITFLFATYVRFYLL